MDLRNLSAIGALAVLSGTAAADRFAVIALPDTQNYVTSSTNAALFRQQTQWVADQVRTQGNPYNIVFVTHLGDVVSSGLEPDAVADRAQTRRWTFSTAGWPSRSSPGACCPGNHDFASTGNKSTGTDACISGYFGAARFDGQELVRRA